MPMPLFNNFFLSPELRQSILSSPDNPSSGAKPQVLPEFKKLFSQLQDSKQQFCDPNEFLQKWRFHSKLNMNQQQDAHEFFNLLTEQIEQEIKQTEQPNFIEQVFKGILHWELCCSKAANHQSEGNDDISSLSLEIENKKKLT